MQNWNQYNWRPLLTTLTLAAFALLIAACSTAGPAIPSDVETEMSRTIERLQKVGPQLQQQLEQMERLHPNLDVSCSSAYPEKCIPPPPPDLDCDDITERNFLVLSPDPHKFDPDGDGIGCEG